jgi:hypothetical protein
MSFLHLLRHYEKDYNSEEDSDYVPSEHDSDESSETGTDCSSEVSESESIASITSLNSFGDVNHIKESATLSDEIPTHVRVYGGQKWLKKNMKKNMKMETKSKQKNGKGTTKKASKK